MKFFSVIMLTLLCDIQLFAQDLSPHSDEQPTALEHCQLSTNTITKLCPTGGGTGIVGYYPIVTASGIITVMPITEQEYYAIICAHN